MPLVKRWYILWILWLLCLGCVFFAFHSLPVWAYIDDSYTTYKLKLQLAIADLEKEFRVTQAVTDRTLANIENLLQEASKRLPDEWEEGVANINMVKSVETYLEKAKQNKTISIHQQNLYSQLTRFLTDVKIKTVEANVTANPTSGNAPLSVSFSATAKDPTGIELNDNNYIWWIKRPSWSRQELWRGPNLSYTFKDEGTKQVFLDVTSNSTNSQWMTDVLTVTKRTEIDVRPKLGNIILLINGVNVSNFDDLKISPSIAKAGVIFDATASKAVSNGVITKTEWDFGNGEISKIDGPPVTERQIFANEGKYKIKLLITSNQWSTFSKEMNLNVINPAAVISVEKDVAYIGEDVSMTAKSYLANTSGNIEYSWTVQPADGGSVSQKNIIISKTGINFSHKFSEVGDYLVTLVTRNPNGKEDTDTKLISIESRAPIVNLDIPRVFSKERPNTYIFDASRSIDADTKTIKDLTFNWTIDGVPVELAETDENGSIGKFTFLTKWPHEVTVTVVNKYGKVTEEKKQFGVDSTLTVWLNITPRAAPISTTVNMRARSPNASFFEWNFWDGTPAINGTNDTTEHQYKKTGIYTVGLVVKNDDGSESNSVTRNVYVTDADKPFALIDIKNNSNTVVEDPLACSDTGTGGAFTINRSENTTLDGGNSINIDGNTTDLSYTWRYMGKIQNGSVLSEKFTELGCYPVELTVRSNRNGATHTSRRYVEIKNIIPKLTSVDVTRDNTKQDTQKVIVNVTANWARDDDGVITSYIWYYTTESDNERQNVRITQTPSTTYVLPNVNEKYYFWVIIEDNDGARIDSQDGTSSNTPLQITNDAANVNMPLIGLKVDKTQALTEESLTFSVTVKNLMGQDVTSRCEYAWDFDGDGKIDQKWPNPTINHKYLTSWRFNMKVKVTNNGTSNSKYQVINIRNELKAEAKGYKFGDQVMFINMSRGTYDRTSWSIGGQNVEWLKYIVLPTEQLTTEPFGSITVSAWSSETNTYTIESKDIETIRPVAEGEINFQSSPEMTDSGIIIQSPNDKLMISLFGNSAKEYIIDTNTSIDSDLNAKEDDDIDNKDTPSYNDGSPFIIPGFGETRSRNRNIKVTLKDDSGKIIATKIIPIILAYNTASPEETPQTTNSWSIGLSQSEKENLEKLDAKIKSFPTEERIIFTQLYNNLVSDWNDAFSRTENLLALQKQSDNSNGLSKEQKNELSLLIDTILVGDAQAVNDVSVASRVIEGMISKSAEKDFITERLEMIKSHPGDLAQNKLLWTAILEKVKVDPNLSSADKLLLKNQLNIIIQWGQQNTTPSTEEQSTQETSPSGGISGFLVGAGKIFGVIFIILAVLLFGLYIFYRKSRKSGDIGFQDFLIDSIAHHKKPVVSERKTAEAVVKALEIEPSSFLVSQKWDTVTPPLPPTPWPIIPQKETENPFEKYTPVSNTSPSDPLAHTEQTAPVTTTAQDSTEDTPVFSETNNIFSEKIPSPLAPSTSASEDTPVISSQQQQEDLSNIPDWLKPVTKPKQSLDASEISEAKNSSSPPSDPLLSVDNDIPWSDDSPVQGDDSFAQDNAEETFITQQNTEKDNISIKPQEEAETLLQVESSETEDVLPSPHPTALNGDAFIIKNPLDDQNSVDTHQQNSPEKIIPEYNTPPPEIHDPLSLQTEPTDALETTSSVSPEQDSPLIPDWLKPTPVTQTSLEKTSSDTTPEKPPTENIPETPAADLPDWLKESIDQPEDTPPETQTTAEKSQSRKWGSQSPWRPHKKTPTPKPKTEKESKKIHQNPESSKKSDNTADIPDWLR